MTEARKRNLVQLNLDKVAAHSPSGRRFEEKYSSTESLVERQALMNNSIAHGYLLEESGLLTVLRVLDTEEFAKMDRAGRINEIFRGASFFAGESVTFNPPAQPAQAPLTLQALERELLSVDGLLANASQEERDKLMSKLIAEYWREPSAIADVPASGKSDVPASDAESIAPVAPASEDGTNRSMSLPKRNKSVKVIKGA